MENITVDQLRQKVDEFLSLKEKVKNLKSEISDLEKQIHPVEFELDQIMKDMDLKRFEGKLGKVSRVELDYVSTPQGDDKDAFHAFLKAEGIYDLMVSVNFQRLNSFYNDRLRLAIEEGKELHIPGLEPKQRVEIRKTR